MIIPIHIFSFYHFNYIHLRLHVRYIYHEYISNSRQPKTSKKSRNSQNSVTRTFLPPQNDRYTFCFRFVVKYSRASGLGFRAKQQTLRPSFLAVILAAINLPSVAAWNRSLTGSRLIVRSIVTLIKNVELFLFVWFSQIPSPGSKIHVSYYFRHGELFYEP